MPLLTLPGIQFHSLQKGSPVGQLSELPPHLSIRNWDPLLSDYADTAAIIAQLDLVISVDTSVAHLAGSLAKPTWVLLCFNSDWRWLLEREDTPYYPTVKLFRQQHPQQSWASLMPTIMAELNSPTSSVSTRTSSLIVDSF
ncbi:MAG: hypothetical protein NW237_00615 [Cyanobacteriota bacterium]|nr:hypothetical protein [Cyanobacteriota bacterium]